MKRISTETAHVTTDANHTMAFITRQEVERITGMSRAWIYQAMAQNKFPKSVQCSPGSVRWVLSEVHAWMQDKVCERDSVQAGKQKR